MSHHCNLIVANIHKDLTEGHVHQIFEAAKARPNRVERVGELDGSWTARVTFYTRQSVCIYLFIYLLLMKSIALVYVFIHLSIYLI
jgi:hypothetical protein